MKQSLGLLEVSGLALAISCADVMAKAASITLLGMEKTNGSGWTVIKIAGDVASVQSAILTGASFAQTRKGLVAQKVIARPGEGIMPPAPQAEVTPSAPLPVSEPIVEHVVEHEEEEALAEKTAIAEATAAPHAMQLVTCNLCLDPACPRLKGEPRSLCIHSGQRGE